MASLSKTAPINTLGGSAELSKLEQDHKRDLDQKHKWALGARTSRGSPQRRPGKPVSQNVQRNFRREVEFQQNKAAQIAKISRKHTSKFDTDNTSDSSAEEDVKDASTAPEPDAGIAYSFDAPQGPGRGSEILSLAINKAVERFEIKATEKLVKDEYEVVGREAEVGNEGYTADEDDFELI